MIQSVRNIFRPTNTSLIRELVVSEFKLKYQNSVLGYLWSLLRPLMMFGVLYVVFTKVIRIGTDVPFYPVYLLLGLVIWTFFVEATNNGMNAITGRGDLVRKVSIPKYTIVVSTTLSAFVNFSLNLIVVIIFMVFNRVPVSFDALLFIPLAVEMFIFSLGLAFFLSAVFVKYRDIGHMWEVILQVLFYATPIIYTFNIVPSQFAKLVSISPLTQIIQDARAALITPETLTVAGVFDNPYFRLVPIFISVAMLVLGVVYFQSQSYKFAEEL